MGILFISHSSRNNDQAIVVRDWLRDHGWRQTFLDLDPEHGLAPGQRWQEELKKAGERCSAVVVLVSPDWVASKWCQVEFLLASQLGKRIFGVIVAPTPFADLPIELTAHYQLVDVSDPATKADGYQRLRFGLKRAGLDPRDFPWPPPDEPNRPAYRGLSALEEKDASVFFGRDAPITRGLDALRRVRAGAPERMLVILGASGAGKSSFLKAGLLARLQRDEENFLVLPTMRPERAALSGPSGLMRVLGVPPNPSTEALASRLAEIRRPLLERLQRFAAAGGETYSAGSPPTLILPIDQTEELFASDNAESADALDLLSAVFAADTNLVAVLTIRSDSFSQLQSESRLAQLPRLPFDLPRLSPGAFKEVIEGPGRLAKPGVQIEPALTERLVAELDSPDALPLLAFTMERLVAEYGADGKLELREFVEELGGLKGAIDQAVEAAFAAARQDFALPKDRAALEALARQAFLPWLVSVADADAPPQRRVAALSDLPSETRGLVGHLVSQRLLVSDARDGQTTVEVSHEAVLRNWRALAAWIEDERDALRTLGAVQAAAKEWRRQATAPDSLPGETWLVHRGERLANTETLLGRPDYRHLLGDAGREYLASCRRSEDAERAEAEKRVVRERKHLERQRKLQRRAALALLAVALAVAGFATFAVRQSRAASRQVSFVLSDYADRAIRDGDFERAARLAILAAHEGMLSVADPAAAPTLAASAQRSSLILELRGHEWTVEGLSVSSDGRLLLTWGVDGTSRVWNAKTGAEIAISTLKGEVWGAMFDASGQRVLSWGEDRTARVWSATTGAAIATSRRGDRINGATFDATGKRVLSWDQAGIVRVWNAATGAQIAASEHDSEANGAMFDAGGTRVLSWGDDGIARVWDAATGVELASSKHGSSILGASFDAAGKRVLSWDSDGIARIWDAATGVELASLKHGSSILGASFDAAGKRVLSWDSDGVAQVWDAATSAPIASSKHRWRVGGALFDAVGKRVLSWSEDGIALVWDAATGAEIASAKHDVAHRSWLPGLPLGSWVNGASFDAAGKRVLSWGSDGIARVWDAATGAEIATSKHRGEVRGAVFDAAGTRTFSCGDDGIVRINKATARTDVAAVKHEGNVRGATFDALGQRVLSWSNDGVARVWNAATGAEIAHSRHGGKVVGATFDPAGRRVLSWSTSEGGKARVWDAATGAKIADWDNQNDVRGAAFDTTGDRVLSWGGDGTVRIWNAATGAEIANLKRHGKGAAGATFDAAGERVLSWGEDGIARVSHAATGAEIATSKHDSAVRSALFDTAGKLVLSRSANGMARVWDAATGVEVSAPKHQGGVSGARFNPAGDRVLSWGEDGAVRQWNAATGAEITSSKHGSGVLGATFNAAGDRVFSWGGAEIAWVWDAATGAQIAGLKRVGGFFGAMFDTTGTRVLSWSWQSEVSVWDATTGVEIASFAHEWTTSIAGAMIDSAGERVLSWNEASQWVRVHDAGWSVPRPSNRELIAEVCARTLRDPESLRGAPLVNGSGKVIPHDSVRRISQADADFAPLLRARVGEDVCAPASWW